MSDALFDTGQQSSVTAFKPGVRLNSLSLLYPAPTNTS